MGEKEVVTIRSINIFLTIEIVIKSKPKKTDSIKRSKRSFNTIAEAIVIILPELLLISTRPFISHIKTSSAR